VSDSLARARLARAAGCLVLMTDDVRLADPLAAARALPRGSMVVVRSRTRLEPLGRALLKMGCTVLIAGDPLLAARLGAHGFHLPQARAGEAAYWRARFADMVITASAHSLRALSRDHVDAIFLSPVFATESHPERTPLTAVRANLMARQARVPVYALGGIDARNAARLSGFSGIAAIGALIV
jgi:thiamine-phosphate pyrophosphorylase